MAVMRCIQLGKRPSSASNPGKSSRVQVAFDASCTHKASSFAAYLWLRCSATAEMKAFSAPTDSYTAEFIACTLGIASAVLLVPSAKQVDVVGDCKPVMNDMHKLAKGYMPLQKILCSSLLEVSFASATEALEHTPRKNNRLADKMARIARFEAENHVELPHRADVSTEFETRFVHSYG